MDRGIQRGQYNYDTETGKSVSTEAYAGTRECFAFLVSAGVAGSVCMGVKRRYSMEPTGRREPTAFWPTGQMPNLPLGTQEII